MYCPSCGTSLVMSDRNGIEIDYCPSCRGVWLDRGELDKIVERSHGKSRPEVYRDRDRDDHGGHNDRAKKKKGFLGDLFDF